MTERTGKAVLAGGCFWSMQDLIREHSGVLSTRVGYTGGDVGNATYQNHGTHAEAIEIISDPDKTSYRDLLEVLFQIHDPTTLNGRGNDVARAIAQQSSTSTMNRVGYAFWEAEPEHQDYLERYRNGDPAIFRVPDGSCPDEAKPLGDDLVRYRMKTP